MAIAPARGLLLGPSASCSQRRAPAAAAAVALRGARLAPPPLRAGRSRARGGVAVAGLFGLGLPELAVIGGVVAVLFGPSKLPELGRSLGKTVKSFQSAAKARLSRACTGRGRVGSAAAPR